MGVLTGRLLADLGAEVIRVESPDGDAVRRRPLFAKQGPELEPGCSTPSRWSTR